MRKVTGNKSDILNRLEILYLELIPALDNFPKKRQYTLGEKIDGTFLAVVSAFYSASYDKAHREAGLIQMRGHLHSLVFLLRISFRLKALSPALYEKFSKELVEIGKIISSWIKKGRES
ncbi:MAG: four helix bundle protein [Bacteriovoracaceae bacterium]|jgi:hypothetical protein